MATDGEVVKLAAFQSLQSRWEREVERRLEVEASLTEAEPPRHDPPDVAYDLRLRLNNAVRWLRRAEDIARVERPGWPTADRIRDIYEQVSDDVLNGKVSVPPLKQRLTEAERRLEALQRYASEALKSATDPEGEDYEPGDEETADMLISSRHVLKLLSTDPARPTDQGGERTEEAMHQHLEETIGDAPVVWRTERQEGEVQ